MAILLDKHSRIVVQGLDDDAARQHAAACRDYAHGRHCLVAGVAPALAGRTVEDIPVFATVAEARAATGADACVVCMPEAQAVGAIEAAAEAGMALVVCLGHGIAANDLPPLRERLARCGTRLLGPGCDGVVTPGEVRIGALPAEVHRRGRIGIVSRSASLTTFVARQLALFGLGTSTAVGWSAGRQGPTHLELLELFEQDRATDAVLLVGAIDEAELDACAAWIERSPRKPLAALLDDSGAGRTQRTRLQARGVRVTHDAGAAGELIASLVEPRWLPFD